MIEICHISRRKATCESVSTKIVNKNSKDENGTKKNKEVTGSPLKGHSPRKSSRTTKQGDGTRSKLTGWGGGGVNKQATSL